MELNEFATSYPELYVMINEDIRYIISDRKITGEESLREWDNMIDNVVRNYEQQNYYGYNMDMLQSQQIFDGFRDRDDRNYYGRRRFNDFNVRDIARLLFLRQLFDRNRR